MLRAKERDENNHLTNFILVLKTEGVVCFVVKGNASVIVMAN